MLSKILREPSAIDTGGENVTSLESITALPTGIKEIPDSTPPPAVETPTPETSEKTFDPKDFAFETPEPKKEEPAAVKPAGRDYSVFRPEHAEILKKSRNEVYEFAKTVLPDVYKAANEAEELRGKLKQVESKTLPESYFQHPEAFVLDESYKEASRDLQLASFEEQHWKQQLISVMNGNKSYKHLKGYKGNQPVFETIEIPDEQLLEVQEELRGNVALATQTKLGVGNQLEGIKRSYAANVQNVVSEMKQAEDTYYPMFKAPTPEQQKVINDVTELIPKQFRNNPLASYVAKAGALNIELINYIKKQEAEIQKLKTGKTNALVAGPGGSELAAPSDGGLTKAGMLDPNEWKFEE